MERVQLPLRRRRAEDEARSLEARLRHEMTARARQGRGMPDVIPSAEELRELVSCAEASRDARQLRRLYEVDHDRALRDADESGSGEPVWLLEERYAGVRLMADVRADRSKAALASATKEPDKTLLPATDKTGHDAVATLEQAGTRKGIVGALGRLVESGGRRRLREQLLEAKDAYLGHLRDDAEGRAAFREAAREIVRECRELGMGFGYYAPAVPELSPEKIQEVRDHAGKQTGAQSERWLADCAQSQKLKDERKLAAVAASRAATTTEIFLPSATTGEDRTELIRREIEDNRHRAMGEDYQRIDKLGADRDQLGRADDLGKSRTEPDRGGGDYYGR
ncbi:MAG: hypothetical protein LC800_01530 [Acidobacteria bacterium]|nr:hypothetical protein [Acidobacteriota bacterium]